MPGLSSDLPPTDNWFVPGVLAEPVLACNGRAAGNEIRSGKFGAQSHQLRWSHRRFDALVISW